MPFAAMRMRNPSGGAPPGTATLNPSDKAANLTLSGGDLIATSAGGAASFVNARATTSKTTGKYYFEFTINARTANIGVGVANSTASLTAFLGTDANAIAWYTGSGTVFLNGSPTATMPTVPVAGIGCVAIDFGNDAIWFRVAGGGWNGGTGDPASNFAGFAFPSGLTGAVAGFAGVALRDTSDQITVNFGGSPFVYTVPSGFGAY